MGNDFSKGVDSAVSIITGIITGDITGGLAGASAPWLAEQIKLHTGHMGEDGKWQTDDIAGNLIAHAILGAVVAELQGNSALSGGVGAVSGELASKVIINTLYGGKDASELTEEEKQTISALSQLASGLAVAAGGGNIGDASAAISSSKNAVENNGLSWADGGNGGNFIGIPYETGANLDSNLDAYTQGYLTEEEIIQLMDDMNSGRFMYDPLREDLKRFPEDLAILVTPYGDYIAFRDADNLGEYAIACVGILPIFKYIKIGGKIIKVETKSGLSLIKEAENAYKAGDITKGNQLMNQAVSHGTEVETTVIRQAHSSNAGKGATGTTSNGYKVSNGADNAIAKADLDHPIVQSRINVKTGDTDSGWVHVQNRHFSGKTNASQFTISETEVKAILNSSETAKIPISNTRSSYNKITGQTDTLYERVITLDKNIGIDKFSGKPTNTMTLLTDKKGNLVTVTPGKIK
ncbi:VENN motif pre-toxin domain-containing protein [Gilliamella apicola]|uniref:VENN motif-containing domain-containing protein n=1 Tax=Gilliamella apicola TaxID=1196095 RepID=A0A2V4DVP2_9GAMM|nr:VENN motif pre-toxin domain-containing protein [Gilliamella apicola]PXZ04782.1 hypothetical protein DKK79_10615 [Gilliamella apicola]